MTDTTETDDLVKRATYALEDMQGRVDAGKLAMFADCIDRIEELEAKLAEVEASSQGWIDAAVEQQVRRKRAEARILEVEAERDAFASNIPDAAQNLIRNAHTGRLKALHRAEAAEARIAHLENHIEGVAKDTHKIMVAYYEAALPAVYQLALADTYLSRDVLPDPTTAELMARINKGEKK